MTHDSRPLHKRLTYEDRFEPQVALQCVQVPAIREAIQQAKIRKMKRRLHAWLIGGVCTLFVRKTGSRGWNMKPIAEPNRGSSVSDPVGSLSHGDIETIEIIRAMLTPEEYRGYLKGNIPSSIASAPYKGKTDEDYAKAKRYYDWLREVASDR